MECDWIDHPQIQEALHSGQNMAPFRRLDNTHAKFRLMNPNDSRAPAGEWMTYAQLVQYCTGQAYAHLAQQQQKMEFDLVRAGYILPTAESAEMRILKMDLLERHPVFMNHDVTLLAEALWDSDQQVFLPLLKDQYEVEQWEMVLHDVRRRYGSEGMLQSELKKCSTVHLVGEATMREKVSVKLTNLREELQRRYSNILEKYPWMKQVVRWCALLVGGLAGAWLTTRTGAAAKCACLLIRTFGYRCTLCGR